MVLLLVGFQPVVKAPIEEKVTVYNDSFDNLLKERKLLQIQYKNKVRQQEIEDKKYYDVPLSEDIQDIIFEYCELYGIGIPLVLAVIEQETGGTFNTRLIHKNNNGTRDFGLLQLNSSNHKWFAEMISEPEFDPLNVRNNLHAGIKFLSILRDQFKDQYSGDELKVWLLNSYNMGVSGFQRYVKKTGKISRGYSNNVLKHREKYIEDGN